MKKLLFTLTGLAAMTQAAYADTFIRHNLAGYFPERDKAAVVMSDINLKGKPWTVSDAGVVVLRGTFGDSTTGKSKFTALAYNYEVDFSAIKNVGDYTINVPGAAVADVSVKDNPYGNIANEMLRVLRVARSGTDDTLDHAKSHMLDAQAPYYRIDGPVENGKWAIDPTGKKADMLGGWYDAGDYIKFTLTIAQTANVLMEAYQANPTIFVKTYSKSQYVDILDEIKFGLDYLMKTMPDSETDEFIIQLSTGKDHVGLPHWRLPENDLRDGEREALSALSPSHMAVTAAALAYGAKTFKPFDPALAATYEAKAIAIYNRSLQADVLPRNAFERDDKNDFYLDEDIYNERILAAARLFELTGDAAYKTEALEFAALHDGGSGLDYYFSETNSILMAYKPLAKYDTVTRHKSNMELDFHLSYANQEGNIWSTAQIPDWGNLANMLYVAGTAAEEIVNVGDTYYSEMAFNNLDYMLGRNPWGISFVNSTGLSKTPAEFHSQIYRLQPDKVPLGLMGNGPSKVKYVAADPDIVVPPNAWEKQFNTSYMVDIKDDAGTVIGQEDHGINYYDNWTNYTGTEPTIFGQATGIYAIAALARLEKEGAKVVPVDGPRPPLKSPPGGLKPEQVPMFVTISSDDNRNPAGVKWLSQLINSKTNPAGATGKNNPFTLDGKPAKMTFLHTGAYVGTVGAEWKAAFDAGNEAGNHTQSHNEGVDGTQLPYATWLSEIVTSNGNIVSTGIPRDQIYGFRAPRLQYNDPLMSVLQAEGFLYDTSIEDGNAGGRDGTNFPWPYTLHDGAPGATTRAIWDKKGLLNIGSYPGLWEIPLSPFIVPPDHKDGLPINLRAKVKAAITEWDWSEEAGKITGFDYNLTATSTSTAGLTDPDEIFAILKHTLDLRLQGNKAPLTIGVHSNYYGTPTAPMAIAVKRFVEYALTHPDVRLATHKQVIDWVQNPRALDDIPHVIDAKVTPHVVTGQCTDPAWDASTLYEASDKVTYQNKTWTSGWQNSNNVPGVAQWGPWGQDGVTCNGSQTFYYGKILPKSGAIPVDENGSVNFTFEADQGKKLLEVKVNGVVVNPLPVNGVPFNNVTGDHTLVATFGDDSAIYTVTAASTGNGTVAPTTAQVTSGGSELFTFVPADTYVVDKVTRDGLAVQHTGNTYNADNVTANTAISVSFKKVTVETFTITATAGTNGSISPAGPTTVNAGGSQLYTFTPSVEYQLDKVTVNGQVVTVTGNQHLVDGVTANTTINASFKKEVIGTCAEPWNSATQYPKGETVSYNNFNYTNKWYSQGENPDSNWGPWVKGDNPC